MDISKWRKLDKDTEQYAQQMFFYFYAFSTKVYLCHGTPQTSHTAS